MKIFDYKINKQSCFVYWVQYMAGWSFNKQESEVNYYLDIIGELNDNEKKYFKKLKKFLKRENIGYNWLWDRYNNKPIKNKDLIKEWQNICNNLKPLFEKIWQQEFPKLKKWKNLLPSLVEREPVQEVMKRSEKFFNVKLNFPISVYLFCQGSKKGAAGGSKKGFNSIFIALSNLDQNFATNTLNTLLHELLHLMLYKSDLEKVLKRSWRKRIASKNIPTEKKGPSWGHLIRESIIYSIAGRNFSYLHRRMDSPFYMKMNDKKELENFNFKSHKNNFSFQAQTVAFKIKELTAKYLNNYKKMNKEFAKKVMKSWKEYRST